MTTANRWEPVIVGDAVIGFVRRDDALPLWLTSRTGSRLFNDRPTAVFALAIAAHRERMARDAATKAAARQDG
jgi:hypothetical protein